MRLTCYALFLTLTLFCGCTPASNEESPSKPKTKSSASLKNLATTSAVDVTRLAKKSPKQVSLVLGKATQITPITSSPEQMPGEFRHYKKKDVFEDVQVRFYRDRAIHFTFYLEKPASEPTDALRRVGVDVTGTRPSVEAQAGVRWQDASFGGVAFKEVATITDSGSGWNIVQVAVE